MKTYPKNIKAILDKYSKLDNTYMNCENLNKELNVYNWYCEYNLEAEVISIKKIN
jgi:hypothetical protein